MDMLKRSGVLRTDKIFSNMEYTAESNLIDVSSESVNFRCKGLRQNSTSYKILLEISENISVKVKGKGCDYRKAMKIGILVKWKRLKKPCKKLCYDDNKRIRTEETYISEVIDGIISDVMDKERSTTFMHNYYYAQNSLIDRKIIFGYIADNNFSTMTCVVN